MRNFTFFNLINFVKMNMTVPSEFGYVIFVVVASIVLLQWLGFKVVQARKRYEVSYPTMYSDRCNEFNCVQRAHQNTLESYPVFLVLLLLAGMQFPKVSAVAGLIWIAGRVAYAVGYYTGDPEKRKHGTFGYIGLLTLLFCTIFYALNLLHLI